MFAFPFQKASLEKGESIASALLMEANGKKPAGMDRGRVQDRQKIDYAIKSSAGPDPSVNFLPDHLFRF